MKELCKVILLTYIGEKVVINMNNEKKEYPKIREALNFCWKWIESKQVDEEKIYELLDDEDEDDLVGYMLYANNERDKKEYVVILGILSYVSHHILTNNKSPIPQFLSGTDDKYYDWVIADVIKLNITDCTKETMIKVTKYCQDKISKNDLIFTKHEIMNIK